MSGIHVIRLESSSERWELAADVDPRNSFWRVLTEEEVEDRFDGIA